MQKVHTKQEAENWFLSHASGTVIAVNANGDEKEVDNYPEAVAFIEGK